MSHQDACILKVGDLLRNPGHMDTVEISFDHFDDLPEMIAPGITGTLAMQGVTDGSVRVMLRDAQVHMRYLCDLTNEPYDTIIMIDEFDARFIVFDANDEEDRYFDDVFPMDGNAETIDVYDFMVQAIRFQEPITHIKPGNEALLDELADDEDDEEENNIAGGGHIYFH